MGLQPVVLSVSLSNQPDPALQPKHLKLLGVAVAETASDPKKSPAGWTGVLDLREHYSYVHFAISHRKCCWALFHNHQGTKDDETVNEEVESRGYWDQNT